MKFLSNKKQLYFTGVYLSFFAFMVCVAAQMNTGIILFKVLTILLFGLFLLKTDKGNTADFEKSVIMFVVLLFQILILYRGKLRLGHEVFDISCCAALIAMCILYFACVRLESYSNLYKRWFAENKLILFIILCFVLLSVEVVNSWLMWDSWAYYTSLMQIVRDFNADLSGIYNLYMCGHASLGYSLWLVFFQLFREGASSLHIADIVLAGISIYAYYQILRKLLRKRYSDKILALASIPYAFSPFVMGMVGNPNLDSATMYFAVIFIACSLYHYECLELIFAFCFCLTKESAIIYFVIYILTKVICEYFSENGFHLWGLLKSGLGNIKNYIYAFSAILWMILNNINLESGWGSSVNSRWSDTGMNCFGISKYVISMKLKQVFLLNFNWIFWVAIVLGIVILVIRKIIKKTKVDRELLGRTIPMGIVVIVIITFGCLYVTWTHARYITPMIPLLYLVATITIACVVKKKTFFGTVSILLSVLLLIQCFWTIDPVMKKTFREISVGSGKLYSLQVEPNERISDHADIRDSIVYNRQYVYWQEILIDALNKAEYDGNMLIVMPNDNNCRKYGYIGSESALWNVKEGRLEYYDEGAGFPENCVEIKSCYVSEAEGAWESSDCKSILYLVPGWTNIDEGFTYENDRYAKEITRRGEVDKKGYHLQYMVIDMNYKASLNNGNYIVTPKQDRSLGLGTNGEELYLKSGGDVLGVTSDKARYQFLFPDYQVFMDIKHGNVDENGTIWVYEGNGTISQKFILEKVEDYYMICWNDYALTYDINSNSVWMSEKTAGDNQLWSFDR